MKNIKVKILNSTPASVLKSALEKPYRTLFKDKSFEKVAYNIIMNMKHQSEAEMCMTYFDIYGISRLNLIELTRHRMASFSVESTRFTLKKIHKGGDMETYFVMPPDPKKEKILTKVIERNIEQFLKNIEILIEAGYSNEYIKYILPENFRVNLTMGMNARSLLNFLYLRLGKGENNPHFEIKHLAELILEEVLKTETGFLFQGFKDGTIK